MEEDQERGTASGTVTCGFVATRESNDREARALRSWQLRRGAFWGRWALTWVVFVAAVLLGVYLLVRWLAPEATTFIRWAVVLGGSMMLAAALVDAATLPQRWLRRYTKAVDRATPVGTPVEQTFATDRFVVSTPSSTFSVPAASVTRATWVRRCLVLESEGTAGAWVMNGDGIDDDALQMALDVLGHRLHQG